MLSKQNTNRQGITLEEMLLIPDVVYMSNWSKMASLIMTYEQTTWKEAGARARELFKIKKAKDYLRAVRVDIALEKSLPEAEPEEKPTPKRQKKKKKYSRKNYELLLKLAPELEQQLFEEKRVFGRSERTGWRSLYLHLFDQHKNNYFLTIGQYDEQDTGDPSPEMKILFDMENRRLEALSFEDANNCKEVYENYHVRNIHHIDQKKQQNAYLTGWLKELIKQGHRIEFDLPEQPLIPIEHENDEGQTETIKTEEIAEKPKQTIDFGQIAKLAKHIGLHERTDGSLARLKAFALKLSGEEKTLDYLCGALLRETASQENNLYRANYDYLMWIMPLLSEVNLEKISGTLVPKKSEEKRIRFEKAPAGSEKIHFIGFQYEDDPEEKTQIIVVNPRTKKAWLVERSEDFNREVGYSLSEEKPDRHKRVDANNQLAKWLLSVGKDYKPQVEELAFKQRPEIDWDEAVNSKIPDFEPGNIQLVAEHERVGISQQDIDWINKHQRGLVLTPILHISKDNKLFIKEMGLPVKLKRGFRISKTGKLYRDERSNV